VLFAKLTVLALAFGATVSAAAPQKAAAPKDPPIVRVRMTTSAGVITLAIDVRHAPKTGANFLAYVDDGRLDGTRFYRAARRKGAPNLGFVQGGIDTDARRRLEPVPLEPTSKTGLHHVDGAISMARCTHSSVMSSRASSPKAPPSSRTRSRSPISSAQRARRPSRSV